jgi:hypothetical protein
MGVALTGAALAAVSLVLPRITPWVVLSDPSSALVRFIDVRAEANLHTWFNVVVLSVGAVLHGCVGLLARDAGRRAWPWAVTCAILAFLAIDDLASLHEQLEPLGRDLGGGSGALRFAWLVPGLALAVGLVLTAVTIARQLPAVSGRWLLAGIATLLAAAVGGEAAGGLLLDSGKEVAYILVSHAEEFAETAAAGMLLCAAVAAVSTRRGPRPGAVEVTYDGARTA